MSVHGLKLPRTSVREDRNWRTPNIFTWEKHYILLTARKWNGLTRAVTSFQNPQKQYSSTKSPYVFEYGHSIKPATVLWRGFSEHALK